jgi:hypothetical protein
MKNLITLNKGRVVRIPMRATNESPVSSWTGGVTKADGGPVDYYADGGMREKPLGRDCACGCLAGVGRTENGGEA